jgi:CelD/BcsL family acetyltransferase involved in cellulose biosynthesis
VTVAVVVDEAGLAALWPEWDALWRRSGASPFLAPAWLRPWWQHFGTGRPLVAVQRDGDALMGLLPLYLCGEKLLPMGVGISDVFDALLLPDASVHKLLAAALGVALVDRCDLPELPEGAVLRDAPAPAGWRREDWAGPPCPVLPLAGCLRESIPKAMHRDLRQARNRTDRSGNWDLLRATAETLDQCLSALIRLHTARWTDRGEAGVLADDDVLGFHRSAAPGLHGAGLLRLGVLRLRGQVAAVIHALLNRDRILFYLSGIDPAFRFESPGTILLGSMLEEAIAEGRREADFLRGGEAYKYAWGAQDRFNAGRSFVRG